MVAARPDGSVARVAAQTSSLRHGGQARPSVHVLKCRCGLYLFAFLRSDDHFCLAASVLASPGRERCKPRDTACNKKEGKVRCGKGKNAPCCDACDASGTACATTAVTTCTTGSYWGDAPYACGNTATIASVPTLRPEDLAVTPAGITAKTASTQTIPALTAMNACKRPAATPADLTPQASAQGSP